MARLIEVPLSSYLTLLAFPYPPGLGRIREDRIVGRHSAHGDSASMNGSLSNGLDQFQRNVVSPAACDQDIVAAGQTTFAVGACVEVHDYMGCSHHSQQGHH